MDPACGRGAVSAGCLRRGCGPGAAVRGSKRRYRRLHRRGARRAAQGQLGPPRIMDAIVIGAGIIGSSIAWRLAQRGCRVTLLDAGRAGGEASWAGAGMLAPGGEVTERTHWSEFALHSLRLYPEFVAELRQESGCPIDFQRNGALEMAPTPAEWPALLERAEKQKTLGIPSVRAERENTLFYPEDAVVDPRDITRALLAACRARNVDVREM